jgi:hypothetical protein
MIPSRFLILRQSDDSLQETIRALSSLRLYEADMNLVRFPHAISVPTTALDVPLVVSFRKR